MPEETYTLYQNHLDAQREIQRQMNLNLANDLNYDPEFATRVWNAVGKTSLPFEVVESDLENIEDSLRRNEFNYANYTDAVNGARVFNEWAGENPYHLAVVERDRRGLTGFERALTPIFMGWDSGWAQIELAEIRYRQMNGDIREGDEETLADLRKWQVEHQFGMGDSLFAKFLVGTAKQVPIQAWLAGESIDETLAGLSAGMIAGAMIPASTGLLAPVAPLTATATAAIGGLVGWRTGAFEASMRLEAGLAYDQYLELGLDEASARTVARTVGVVNGLLEATGFGAIFKKVPGMKELGDMAGRELVQATLTRPTTRKAITNIAINYGQALGTEVFTEVMQESMTIAGQEFLKSQARAGGDLRPETVAMSWDEYKESVADIAAETIYGAGLISALGPTYAFYRDMQASKRAQIAGRAWEMAGEKLSETEIVEKAPKKFREFLQRLQEKGPISEVGVDVRGFKEYFQSIGVDPAEAAEELGVDLAKAEVSDTDLKIPLKEFAQKIAATEHLAGLKNHVRVHEGDMTLAEAQAWEQNRDAAVKELQKILAEENTEPDQRIVDDVKQQLQSRPNYDEESATQQAEFMAAIFTTQAIRNPNLQMSPFELYELRVKGIRGEQPEIARPESIDMRIDPYLDMLRAGEGPKQVDMYGPSLLEYIHERGGIWEAEGGELSAMDLREQMLAEGKFDLVRRDGHTLDAARELAEEAGYLKPDSDIQNLLDAIRDELAGNPMFSRLNDSTSMAEARELNEMLEALYEAVEQVGGDLQAMSNEDIRKLLGEGQIVFDQIDFDNMDDLSNFVLFLMNQQIEGEFGKQTINPDVGAGVTRLWISETQDFGDQVFTDTVRVIRDDGTEEIVEVERAANDVFAEAVDRRNVLNRLMDCLSGR